MRIFSKTGVWDVFVNSSDFGAYQVALTGQLNITASDQSTTWVFQHDDIIELPKINWKIDLGGGFGKTSAYKMSLSSSLAWIKENLANIVGAEASLQITLNNSDAYMPSVGRIKDIKRFANDPNRFDITVYDKFQDASPKLPLYSLTDSYDSVHPALLDNDWGFVHQWGVVNEDRPLFFTPVDCHLSQVYAPRGQSFYNNSMATYANTFTGVDSDEYKVRLHYGTSSNEILQCRFRVASNGTAPSIGGNFSVEEGDRIMDQRKLSSTYSRLTGGLQIAKDFELSEQVINNELLPIYYKPLSQSTVFTYGVELVEGNLSNVNYVNALNVTFGRTYTAGDSTYNAQADCRLFGVNQNSISANFPSVSSYDSATINANSSDVTRDISIGETKWNAGANFENEKFYFTLVGSSAVNQSVSASVQLNYVTGGLKSEAFTEWSLWGSYNNTRLQSIYSDATTHDTNNENPLQWVYDRITDTACLTMDNVVHMNSNRAAMANRFSVNCYYGNNVANFIYGPRVDLIDEIDMILKGMKVSAWVADSGSVKFADYLRQPELYYIDSADLIRNYIDQNDMLSFSITDNPLGVTRYKNARSSEFTLDYNYSYTEKHYKNSQNASKNNNAFCDSAFAAGIDKLYSMQSKYIVDSETAANVLDSTVRLNTAALTYIDMELTSYWFCIEVADFLQIRHPMIVGSEDIFFVTDLTHDYQNGIVKLTAASAPILYTSSLANPV